MDKNTVAEGHSITTRACPSRAFTMVLHALIDGIKSDIMLRLCAAHHPLYPYRPVERVFTAKRLLDGVKHLGVPPSFQQNKPLQNTRAIWAICISSLIVDSRRKFSTISRMAYLEHRQVDLKISEGVERFDYMNGPDLSFTL